MTVNFDHNRDDRTGVAEVILAEPKKNVDLRLAIVSGLENKQSLLVTRIKEKHVQVIKDLTTKDDIQLEWDPYQRTAILGEVEEVTGEPRVAIISGGTSDQPIVEEIKLSLAYFGINSVSFPDVGVAGIHRHQEVFVELENYPEISCLIVVAGNEGALFSVISGQTKLPVIAVPTSIGYGFGGKGKTALQSALQSCSPGVVAVNIDNGFGAAAFVRKLLHQS